MNQCVNLHLKKYGLSAESTIEYCDKNNNVIELGMYEKHLGHLDTSLISFIFTDPWNLTFYIIISVLVLMVVASSIFDLYLKHKNSDKLLTDRDHYKSLPSTIGKL